MHELALTWVPVFAGVCPVKDKQASHTEKKSWQNSILNSAITVGKENNTLATYLSKFVPFWLLYNLVIPVCSQI